METDLWIRALLALILVAGLIGVVAILARKFLPSHLIATHSKDKRVNIEEVTYIDPKHRLLLIKRDDIRHLVMVGATSSIVIESHIEDQTTKNKKAS